MDDVTLNEINARLTPVSLTSTNLCCIIKNLQPRTYTTLYGFLNGWSYLPENDASIYDGIYLNQVVLAPPKKVSRFRIITTKSITMVGR